MRMLTSLTPEWSWTRRGLSTNVALDDAFDDFDRVMNNLFQPTYSSNASSVNFQPRCNIKETKAHFLLSFDLPGVKKEDISIEVQNNRLVIAGERSFEMKEEDGESTLRHECSYGKFERTFALPSTISAEKIEAHYENGVLSIALPKAESSKGRTIQIQSGQDSFLNKLLGTKKDGTKDLKDVKIS